MPVTYAMNSSKGRFIETELAKSSKRWSRLVLTSDMDEASLRLRVSCRVQRWQQAARKSFKRTFVASVHVIVFSPFMARPFALSGPLPFQRPLLFQHAFPLPVLLRKGIPRAFDVALDLRTTILTTPRPRGL